MSDMKNDRYVSLKIDSNFHQVRDSYNDKVVCHAFNDEDAYMIEKALNNHELLIKIKWEKIK